jgi:hypothetical protein
MRKPAIIQPAAPTTLAFSKRGHRRKAEYGLYYRSRCGLYALYRSDQVGGVPVSPIRWLAITYKVYAQAGEVIGRHRTRSGAERSCVRHSRRR